MKRLLVLSTLFCAASTSFGAYYFTRGLAAGENPNGDVYTRNWSDINNWSTKWDGDMGGTNQGYNHLNQLPAEIPNGIGVAVQVDVFSGSNGASLPSSDERLINVDIDNLTLGSFSFDNTQNSVNRLTGKAITFETTGGGGTIITKSRPWNHSIVDNDIVIKGSSVANGNSMAYTIHNKAGSDAYAGATTRNLYINGNITTDISQMDLATSGAWDFLRLNLDPTKNTIGSGNLANIYVNGKVTMERCLNVTGGNVSATDDQFGKVYIGGSESNQMILKVNNIVTAVLQKTNGAIAAQRIELYRQGAVSFTTSNQVPVNTYVQFGSPLLTKIDGNKYSGSNVGGILYMNGNNITLGELQIRNDPYGTNVPASNVVGKIDFGAESAPEGRRFDFQKLTFLQSELTSGSLILDGSGLVIVNFDASKDKLTCATDTFTYQDAEGWNETGRIVDHIWFEGYGTKDVDYIVTSEFDGGLGGYVFGLQMVPEASTCAAFAGICAMGLALYRRRK